ncbi:uncharacterized protein LOC117318422 [Pecten maximus]|uniref:uncharacterized protein LOC117318422 n=1 Tax=Pecten maximus TaxID=6579 RepID=UPI001458CDBB|nr:uncharacterized protein LOC117318422 [Pecten maximus]
MAGTVPLASDNVIPETKDDRMENQVHEGMVNSSPQREGEVVNSSPQPDGGVVEPCPQREGMVVESCPQPHEGMDQDHRHDTTNLERFDFWTIPIAGTATNNTTTSITGISQSTNLVDDPPENTVCLEEADNSVHPNPTSDVPNDPASSIAFETKMSSCQSSDRNDIEWRFVGLIILMALYSVKLQDGLHQVPSNDLQDPWRRCATMADSTTNHQNLSSVDPPLMLMKLPRTDFIIQEEGIRRGADVQFTNDTLRCEARPCPDEEAVLLSDIFQPTSVNGTNNEESYINIMLRQERSHSQNHPNVIPISDHNYTTSSTDMGPDSDEATSSEGEELQSNITTRPPESRPQGVPHGGRLDPLTRLNNTCNLDQLVNGQYLICLFRPIRNLLEDRAQRFPETYGHLWHALRLCEAGQFAAAKFYLAPLYDMYSAEGTRVMPLIEGQLRHFFSTSCQKCGYCHDGVPIADICLNEYNRIGGFQEALRAAFSRPDGTCIQQGCQGRTTAEVRFECGTPPLIIAVNLYYLHRFIPNSQSVDFTEIVELFGERYMMFLFTLLGPDYSENGSGHYMSYVFRPDGGGEVNSDGIPVGKWYWYPNNENGDLVPFTPGQADLEGTIPSYVYFILVPPSSSGGATSSGRGEQCPKKGGRRQ